MQAFKEFCLLLGADRVLDGHTATCLYGQNTLGIQKNIIGALIPLNTPEIIEILKIANHYKTPLYPISTGRNWGYGSASPVRDNCFIVDLSKMNKILEMDNTLGLVTLQPGVTQAQLKQFLEINNLPFMVPVTGSSHQCSILGNALERGFGINPNHDHFAAITSLEAILPNGEIYRSPLSELGGALSCKAYKWGIGPYIDGLFAQSNLGIVTSVTIALAPKPDHIEAVFFNLESDDQLFHLIDPLHKVIQTVGSNMASIKITSQHRLLAAMKFYPDKNNRFNAKKELSEQFKKNSIHSWLGFSAIYGDKKVVYAIKKYIKSSLKPYAKKLLFLNPKMVHRTNEILDFFPILKKTSIAKKFNNVNFLLKFMDGTPHSASMPMAYYGSQLPNVLPAQLNPDLDGCGLIWFTPLIPLKQADIQQAITVIKPILIKHGMETAMTITSLSNYVFDLTIPLLFDAKNNLEVNNAHCCYEAMFKACQNLGYLPYRMPTEFMSLITTPNNTCNQFAQQIKNVIDPTQIISPGRYI